MFPKLGSKPEADIKTTSSTTPKRGRSTDEDTQQENKKVKNPTNARRSKVADNTIEISEKAIFNVGKRRSLTLKSKHIQHNLSSDQQIVNQLRQKQYNDPIIQPALQTLNNSTQDADSKDQVQDTNSIQSPTTSSLHKGSVNSRTNQRVTAMGDSNSATTTLDTIAQERDALLITLDNTSEDDSKKWNKTVLKLLMKQADYSNAAIAKINENEAENKERDDKIKNLSEWQDNMQLEFGELKGLVKGLENSKYLHNHGTKEEKFIEFCRREIYEHDHLIKVNHSPINNSMNKQDSTAAQGKFIAFVKELYEASTNNNKPTGFSDCHFTITKMTTTKMGHQMVIQVYDRLIRNFYLSLNTTIKEKFDDSDYKDVRFMPSIPPTYMERHQFLTTEGRTYKDINGENTKFRINFENEYMVLLIKADLNSPFMQYEKWPPWRPNIDEYDEVRDRMMEFAQKASREQEDSARILIEKMNRTIVVRIAGVRLLTGENENELLNLISNNGTNDLVKTSKMTRTDPFNRLVFTMASTDDVLKVQSALKGKSVKIPNSQGKLEDHQIIAHHSKI